MIEKLFTISWKTSQEIFLSALGIYLAVIVLTRISGKRSFSKMSSFDFAMTVGIGSIIASTILSESVKLVEGIIGLCLVYVLQLIVAWARKISAVEAIVDNKPLLLMDGEKILYENLQKTRVTESDLRSKLREANVIQLYQVKAVVFETTGDISVLHSNEIELDPWILTGVKNN